MSWDLVPGWMRRFALASMAVCSMSCPWRIAFGPKEGDFGPIWISAGGGGLGSRGELGGSAIWAEGDDGRAARALCAGFGGGGSKLFQLVVVDRWLDSSYVLPSVESKLRGAK